MVLLDEVQAVVDDGQGDEPQEVHLEHAYVLNVVAVELRGANVFAGFLVLGQGDGEVIREVSAADDGGTRMHAHLPHAAFQRLCVLQDLLVELRSVLELLNELRHKPVAVFQGDFYVYVLQAHLVGFLHLDLLPVLLLLHFFFHYFEAGLQLIQLGVEGVFLLLFLAQAVRHHLGEAVALVNAQVADARNVLEGALGGHRTKGNHA